MKKARIFPIFPLILLLLLLSSLLTVSAAAPKATLTATSTLRAGDTFTVTMYVDGDSLQALQGTLTYDAGKLTYRSASASAKGWDISFTHTSGSVDFLCIDEELSAPINSRTKMMTFTFVVKANLATGTSVRLTATDLSASDGETDFTLAQTSYSVKIAPPKSDDCTLSVLQSEEASLTPDFAPDVTDYTAATVPFDVSSLTLKAEANDDAAEVAITGNELVVGENTIEIKVTAENGDTMTYRIRVEREQDPNYVPSSDGALSAITLSAGQLSPPFTPETLDYLVVVPYETEEFTAIGTARHPLALGGAEQTVALREGENLITLYNRAEDGSEMGYSIFIIRLPKYDGLLPTVTPGTEAPPETEPPPSETEPPSRETEPPATTGQAPETPPVGDSESLPESNEDAQTAEPPTPATTLERLTDRTVLIAIGSTAAVMLGIGLVIGALAARPKRYKYRK